MTARESLLINCSNLRIGGGLQVAHSFLEQLRTRETGWRFVITLSDELSRLVDREQYPDTFHFESFCIRPSWWKTITGHDRWLHDLVEKNSVVAAFSPFGPSYWRPRNIPHVVGFAKPQYVIRNAQFLRLIGPVKRSALAVKEFLHLLDFRLNNDALITENEAISDLIRTRLPGKSVHTVTNTYNQIFRDPEAWDRSIDLPAFEGVTLLTIAADYPHKNLRILLQVAKRLLERFPELKFRFVLSIAESVFDAEELAGVADKFVFLGPVKLHQCPWLYSQSDVMILPTLLECFSASYAEAMVLGVPIATSDLAFARGLCGDAAKYFDPGNPDDIADAVVALARDDQLRRTLVEKGERRLSCFDTPESRATKYLRILESAIQRDSGFSLHTDEKQP